MIYQEQLSVSTHGQGFYEVTSEIARIAKASGVERGTAVVFVRHTSASLLIQENAAAAVQKDLGTFLSRIAPEDAGYAHDDEGPDDMPAHLRSAITKTSEVIPISSGKLVLGTWQGVYLAEHRHAAHKREIFVHVSGE